MKLTNKARKAEMQSQIFIYILAMVIGVGILLYGYNAIKGFKSQADDVLLLQFENGIRNDLKTISFESTKVKTYDLPSTVSQICFSAEGVDAIDVQKEEARQLALKKNYKYPLIRTAIGDYLSSGSKGTTNNVFIYPNGEKAFFTGVKIEFDKASSGDPVLFKCFDIKSGILSVRIKGKGSTVLIQ
ncbi:TPA: hypothetical protein HA219_02620 [Candidatus Woesearchaeota archaeon]|nr:hypothetical protein [Candidatus Woesearchaeota archaeon]HIH39587.1 hypothetical protein [Candidatus Woesearchaeota archaeon]